METCRLFLFMRDAVTDNVKLMKGHREEVIYQMRTAYEYLFHSGVEPEGGLLLGNDPCPYDDSTQSKGTAREDRNVDSMINPETNLGVRIWPVSEEETAQHPVYNEPTEEGDQFNDPPYSTFGVVNYVDKSNLQLDTDEFGQNVSRTAEMMIPFWHHYKFELPKPLKGDLVEFWSESWHTLGVFYNVVKVNEGQHIKNTNYFTEWVLELKREDEFVPERRLLGEY